MIMGCDPTAIPQEKREVVEDHCCQVAKIINDHNNVNILLIVSSNPMIENSMSGPNGTSNMMMIEEMINLMQRMALLSDCLKFNYPSLTKTIYHSIPGWRLFKNNRFNE